MGMTVGDLLSWAVYGKPLKRIIDETKQDRRMTKRNMTKEEAIEILEEVKELDDSIYQYNTRYLEALDMAITALEKEGTKDDN